MKICCTGHRPKTLPTGYNLAPLIALAKPWLAAKNTDAVLTGMALGFDQAVALAALDLGIPVHAYIPFIGQADAWPSHSHALYQSILRRCASQKIVSPGGYEAWKMQARNEAMVDDADHILALWNGEKGGTANCLAYAAAKNVPSENLWWIYDMEL